MNKVEMNLRGRRFIQYFLKMRAMKTIYERFTKRTLLSILIIHFSMLSFAAKYYVSNSGNDSNSGVTTSLPWKTLAKVNTVTFQPDDQVLFNSGEIFVGQLTILSSGTSGHPITFGKYGTGANPTINANNSNARCISTTGRSYITIDGIDCTNATEFGIGTSSSPGKYVTIQNLKVSAIGTDNNERVGINQTGGYTTITYCTVTDISQNGIQYGGSNNIITHNNISNTNARYTGWGAGIAGDGNNDELAYNLLDNCGGIGADGLTHGIYVGTGSTNANVHDNTITNSVRGSGIKSNGGGNFHHNNVSISRLSGIEVGFNSTNVATLNIYYNTFAGNRSGVSQSSQGTGAFTLNIYNNTFYRNNNTAADAYCQEIAIDNNINTALVIQNNILYGSGRYTYAFSVAQTHATINNNLVYQPTGNLVYYNGAARNWATWQGYGFDTNGKNADPLLVSPPSDFNLKSTSPAIDAGSPSSMLDPDGTIADVGAYYFKKLTVSTFTFSGPSSGNINSASTNFTITPNNLFTGTITITPTGIGSAGLLPKVLTYSNSSASQTFTITPTVVGSITLTATNNGTLINPASLTYTANAVVPGTPTSPVATAGNGSASVTFVASTSNGGSVITGYTVTSIPAGGIDANAGSTLLTHSITGLTNGTSYTFTVKAANSVGTSPASVASNSVIPKAPVATSFLFTGPSSGNVNTASANFTVTPNNSFTGTITLMPTGTGSVGLSAKVLTFSNSSTAQTFTITPTVAGSIILTATNNGTLTNPVSLTYAANVVVSGAPTSVVATAGNAKASVSFVAPVNNGGSAITGYTVTSFPAGGTDINAGLTSLNHAITGLTNSTSYTFTVKATNLAGTSVASAASNSVVPVSVGYTEYKSICEGTNYNGWTTTGKYSRTLAAKAGGDSIVTTYLTVNPKYSITENISITEGENYKGWTVSGTYSRNLTSISGCDSLVTTNLTVASVIIKQGAVAPSHFTTVWQGLNGLNHMNINVVSAIVEDLPLSVDDEIAVFSGSACVGTAKLTKSIVPTDNTTFLTILASQNDGSGNGFIENDTIIFKIWDSKNMTELQANGVVYHSDISTWKTTGRYVPGATTVVDITSYKVYTQSIELLKGYNMISAYVSAQNPNVSLVTKTLVNQGNLVKMQDETGNSFENWGDFGGWINKIGSIEKTEGYKIQVANNCTLQVTGRPIAMPLDIALKAGWNIISFPRTDMVNAISVVQSLIDQNKLVKVQDEAGNSIENWGLFGGWKNGIGNLIPGKAYKVKMNADGIFTFQENYPKSAAVLAHSEKTEYFNSSVEGNGTDHMNVNITGLRQSAISVGDELAAFDGELCVGTIKITEANLLSGSVALVTSFSTNDQSQNGFKVGDPIQISVWNKLSGDESKVIAEVVSGQMRYEKNSSVLITMKSITTGIVGLDDAIKIDVFPNPSQGKVTVRFSDMPQSNSRIEILDLSGRRLITRIISGTSEEFDLEHLTSGLYLVKSILGSSEFVQKLIVKK